MTKREVGIIYRDANAPTSVQRLAKRNALVSKLAYCRKPDQVRGEEIVKIG
jgi:hypothetical protein